MKIKKLIILLLCLSLIFCSGVFYDLFTNTRIVNAKEFKDYDQSQIVKNMGAGWNLGNQLEASINGMPYETAWGNPTISENLILAVKEAGFKTIRIPISYLNKITYDTVNDKYTINEAWLDRIQEVVDYCVNNDIYAIINMHGDGYKSVEGSWLICDADDQTSIKKKYEDCWAQISDRFKDYDEHLIFESMNEEFDGTYANPNWNYYANINSYNQIFVDTVRKSGGNNDKRWLLIPGWNTNIEYTVGNYGFSMPSDNYLNSDLSGKRIMISVHYYDPWNFAGSGEDTQWGDVATDISKVSSWGQKDYMKQQFEKLYNKFVSQGYPVVIGEYGATDASNFDNDNMTCRKYWYKCLCEYAYENGCIPVTWDNNGHNLYVRGDQFGLFDRSSCTLTANGQEIVNEIMSVYKSTDPSESPKTDDTTPTPSVSPDSTTPTPTPTVSPDSTTPTPTPSVSPDSTTPTPTSSTSSDTVTPTPTPTASPDSTTPTPTPSMSPDSTTPTPTSSTSSDTATPTPTPTASGNNVTPIPTQSASPGIISPTVATETISPAAKPNVVQDTANDSNSFDNNSRIIINLKKNKIYNSSKKIRIRSRYNIKKVLLNNHLLKTIKNKNRAVFFIKRFKNHLKINKKNTIQVVDVNNYYFKVSFRIKR